MIAGKVTVERVEGRFRGFEGTEKDDILCVVVENGRVYPPK